MHTDVRVRGTIYDSGVFFFFFFFCICVNISWVESAISVAYVSSVGMGDYVSLNNKVSLYLHFFSGFLDDSGRPNAEKPKSFFLRMKCTLVRRGGSYTKSSGFKVSWAVSQSVING